MSVYCRVESNTRQCSISSNRLPEPHRSIHHVGESSEKDVKDWSSEKILRCEEWYFESHMVLKSYSISDIAMQISRDHELFSIHSIPTKIPLYDLKFIKNDNLDF